MRGGVDDASTHVKAPAADGASAPVVVLHHGIFGFDEIRLGPVRIPHFRGVERALGEAGFPVVLTRAHPCASIPRRAADLKACVLERLRAAGLSGRRVVLVAHSLGGLDARYMISRLGMARHIAALVTISTPHRGASLADFWHLHLGQRLKVYDLLSGLGLDIGAAYDLTRVRMAAFNEQVPDDPGVRYCSITCSMPFWKMRGKLMLTHQLVAREEGDNDGVVAVRSATWGEHLAHWEVDHLTAINRPRLVGGVKGMAGRYVEAVRAACAGGSPDGPAGNTGAEVRGGGVLR